MAPSVQCPSNHAAKMIDQTLMGTPATLATMAINPTADLDSRDVLRPTLCVSHSWKDVMNWLNNLDSQTYTVCFTLMERTASAGMGRENQ